MGGESREMKWKNSLREWPGHSLPRRHLPFPGPEWRPLSCRNCDFLTRGHPIIDLAKSKQSSTDLQPVRRGALGVAWGGGGHLGRSNLRPRARGHALTPSIDETSAVFVRGDMFFTTCPDTSPCRSCRRRASVRKCGRAGSGEAAFFYTGVSYLRGLADVFLRRMNAVKKNKQTIKTAFCSSTLYVYINLKKKSAVGKILLSRKSKVDKSSRCNPASLLHIS